MFLSFGEVMARVAPPGNLRWAQTLPGAVEVTWGGGEANVAASLAMLGNSVRYVTALPPQPVAKSLERSLMALGVDTSHLVWREQGRLGLYFVEVGANQRGSTFIYDREHSAVSLAAAEEYDFTAALNGVKHVHVTGITPAISEAACNTNLELLKVAKANGCQVSCDLNFRKKLWGWRGTDRKALARECMESLLPYVDIVIGNEGDAEDVLGIRAAGTDVEQGELNVSAYVNVAQQIVDKFPNVAKVAITLRESISADHNNWGAMLFDAADGEASLAPLDVDGNYTPYKIKNIVDRVGAGDSFAAGLLHAVYSPDYKTGHDVIAFAVAASCLKHSIKGDFNFVEEDEVVALVGGNTTGRVQR